MKVGRKPRPSSAALSTERLGSGGLDRVSSSLVECYGSAQGADVAGAMDQSSRSFRLQAHPSGRCPGVLQLIRMPAQPRLKGG